MIVSEQDPTKNYVYSGPGDYPFPFYVVTETDVRVQHTSDSGVVTDLTYSTDYTVTLVSGGTAGGKVTVTSPAGSGGSILVYRHLPITQLTDWVNSGPMDMEVLEKDFDRVILILQQMNSVLDERMSVVNWKGNWVTGHPYETNNVVAAPSGSIYACVEAHTSGVFATDLSAGKWRLVADIAAATTAAANAAVSETNAAVSETNAAVSETNAAASAVLAQQALADGHSIAEGRGIRIETTGSGPMVSTVHTANGADVASDSIDWNGPDVARAGCSHYLPRGSNPNGPGGSSYFYPFNFEYDHKDGTGNMTQLAIGYNMPKMFLRHRYAGAWTPWTEIITGENNNSIHGGGASVTCTGSNGATMSSAIGNFLSVHQDIVIKATGQPHQAVRIGCINTSHGVSELKFTEDPAAGGSHKATFFPIQNNLTRLGLPSNSWADVFSYHYTTSSDERLKNFDKKTDSYSWFYELDFRSFEFKACPGVKRFGLSAQEAEKIIPSRMDIIHKPASERDFYGVDYTQFIPILCDIAQKQRQMIKDLQQRIEILEEVN